MLALSACASLEPDVATEAREDEGTPSEREQRSSESDSGRLEAPGLESAGLAAIAGPEAVHRVERPGRSRAGEVLREARGPSASRDSGGPAVDSSFGRLSPQPSPAARRFGRDQEPRSGGLAGADSSAAVSASVLPSPKPPATRPAESDTANPARLEEPLQPSEEPRQGSDEPPAETPPTDPELPPQATRREGQGAAVPGSDSAAREAAERGRSGPAPSGPAPSGRTGDDQTRDGQAGADPATGDQAGRPDPDGGTSPSGGLRSDDSAETEPEGRVETGELVRASPETLFVVELSGAGWIFVGLLEPSGDVEYVRRELGPDGASFVFRAAEPGRFELQFQRQDLAAGTLERRQVPVEVGRGESRGAESGPPEEEGDERGSDEAMNDEPEGVLDRFARIGDGSPTTADELFALGMELTEAGFDAEARETFELLLNRYPGYPRLDTVHLELAEIYDSDGSERDIRRAAHHYEQIVDSYPLSEHYLRARERLRRLDRHFLEVR